MMIKYHQQVPTTHNNHQKVQRHSLSIQVTPVKMNKVSLTVVENPYLKYLTLYPEQNPMTHYQGEEVWPYKGVIPILT